MSKYYKAEDIMEIFSDESRPENWMGTEAEIQEQVDFDFYKSQIENLQTIEVNEDCISKKFISDSLIHRIAELNKQGEKAIPIQTELIKFKKFIDSITPLIPTERIEE